MKRKLSLLTALLFTLLVFAGCASGSGLPDASQINEAIEDFAGELGSAIDELASDEGSGSSFIDDLLGEETYEDDPLPEQTPDYADVPEDSVDVIDEYGTYDDVESVCLYLETYGHLPDNYITKDEARELGWEGGSVERYAPGCCIGGDRFGNYEELLPKAGGRQYYECDIDTLGKSSRGAKRIVFSNDGLIYYTDDHYESFTLLSGEE